MAGDKNEYILSINGMSKSFGRNKVLKHISLNVTQSAKDYLINNGYDEVYGARPLKRFIQSEIETKLAKEIIKGTVHQGQHVEVDYQDGFVLKAQ